MVCLFEFTRIVGYLGRAVAELSHHQNSCIVNLRYPNWLILTQISGTPPLLIRISIHLRLKKSNLSCSPPFPKQTFCFGHIPILGCMLWNQGISFYARSVVVNRLQPLMVQLQNIFGLASGRWQSLIRWRPSCGEHAMIPYQRWSSWCRRQ